MRIHVTFFTGLELDVFGQVFVQYFSCREYRKIRVIARKETEGGDVGFLWNLHGHQLLHCNHQYFWDHILIFPTKSSN